MTQELISLQNISFKYAGNQSFVLRNVSFHIHKGEFLGVIGPSGGGKTTLLRLILGLLKPVEGEIKVFGQKPSKSVSKIGYVPQFSEFDKHFPITVEEMLLSGMQKKGWWGYTKEQHDKVQNLLEDLKIGEFSNQSVGELSGGQLQRAMIARSLIFDPEVLLLDEPTASVDKVTGENIFDILKELNKNITILAVSHDIGFVSRYIEKVICLNKDVRIHTTRELDGGRINSLYKKDMSIVCHESDCKGDC